MKKVLLSLLLAIACMPMAFGQSKASHMVITDTTVCGKFTWSVNNVTYNSSASVAVTIGDTAYFLNLNMLPPVVDTLQAIPVEGVCSATWNNKTWNTPGNFYDTLMAVNGCDSIVKVAVTLQGTDTVNETLTKCGSYSAPWGTTYTSNTTLENELINAGHCNYLVTMNLTINPVVTMPTEQVAEAGCSYTWNNQTITDTEIHYDTLTTAMGCDSIISVKVNNFTGEIHDTLTVTACDQYIFNNDTLTISNEYLDTIADGGCQHITHLMLTIVNSATDTANVVVREVTAGCRYDWLGNSYTVADTNRVIYGNGKTVVGNCDSLMAIRLISFTGTQRDTNFVENCGKYRWSLNNVTYTEDAIDSVVSTGANNCHQIDYLHLTLISNYDTVTAKSCEKYTYTFVSRRGVAGANDQANFTESGLHTVDENGTPLYSTSFNTGCVTYHALDLTIIPVHIGDNPDTIVATACDSYIYSFDSRNNIFEESVDTSLTKSSRTNRKCEDSTIHLRITIKHKSFRDFTETACDNYFWPVTNETYTSSTTVNFTDTNTVNSEGCDSVNRLNLTINYTPEVTIEGDWNLNPEVSNTTVLKAVDNPTDHNTYKWFKNNETTPFSTADSVTVTVSTNTDIRLETTSNKGCVAKNWITVTYNVGIDEVEGLNVALYPNPTSRFLNVESADGISEVIIYNAIGQQVIRRSVNATNTQLDLGALAVGNYTMQILSLDGNQATRKFIVNK